MFGLDLSKYYGTIISNSERIAVVLTTVCAGIFITLLASPLHLVGVVGLMLLVMMACLVVGLIDPKILFLICVICIPLELSKTFFPFLQRDKNVGDLTVSLVDFARLAMLCLTIVWVIILSQKKRMVLQWQPLYGYIMVYLAWCAISVLFVCPSKMTGAKEFIRYVFLGVFFLAFTQNLKFSRHFPYLANTIQVMGFLLACLAIFQYYSGIFFWNENLDGFWRRVNVTFGDPNIFARYLDIVIIFGLFRPYPTRDHRVIGWLATFVCMIALLFTYSRGGWLALIAGIIPAVIFFLRKRPQLTLALSSVALLGLTFIIWSIPGVAARLFVFDQGLQSMGQRVALIITAAQIFKSSPITGIGLGQFREVALAKFSEWMPLFGRGTQQSHTEIMTILAELGSVGFILLLTVLIYLLRTFWREMKLATPWQQSQLLCITGSAVMIFVASQSAGMLWEDANWWLMLGLFSCYCNEIKNTTVANVNR